MADNDFEATELDVQTAASLCGMQVQILVTARDANTDAFLPDLDGDTSDIDVQRLLNDMGEAAFSADPDEFAQFAGVNKSAILEVASVNKDVATMLVLGYKIGISAGSAACMNDLGTLYYMGNVVEQDYVKAAELYEMAVEHGCYQSIINLGYIWEYGRTGQPNPSKAYNYYALAAGLANSYEAVYKLGDMYARGMSVEKDMAKAYGLWKRSLDLAEDIAEAAQPSIRIAQLLISDDCEQAHVERDPLLALHLFQNAEIGLRISINNGETYYAKRLEEAIEGQEVARVMLLGLTI